MNSDEEGGSTCASEHKIPSPVQPNKMVYKILWMTENDDDKEGKCDICQDDDDNEGDEIVICDGCNVAVHQTCYGRDIFNKLPDSDDEWFCQRC